MKGMFLFTLVTLEKLKDVSAGAAHDVRLGPVFFCHTAPFTPLGQAVEVRVCLCEYAWWVVPSDCKGDSLNF